jgi:hypothetical protein
VKYVLKSFNKQTKREFMLNIKVVLSGVVVMLTGSICLGMPTIYCGDNKCRADDGGFNSKWAFDAHATHRLAFVCNKPISKEKLKRSSADQKAIQEIKADVNKDHFKCKNISSPTKGSPYKVIIECESKESSILKINEIKCGGSKKSDKVPFDLRSHGAK